MQGAFRTISETMADEVEILCISKEDLDTIKNSLPDFVIDAKNPNDYYVNKNGYQILYDKNKQAYNTYYASGFPSNYMIDKWGYFYKEGKDKVPSDEPILKFTVGTMRTLPPMKDVINAAIERVASYKKPWEV